MRARSRNHAYGIAGIILMALLVYLIGNDSVSLWDRDEPRYAQTSRQMLQSGDWIVPRLLDEPREKKPVFIYWCQATAMRLFGETRFAARLPSVVFVTLTLGMLAAALWRMVGPKRALWTTLIFASSGLTIATAKMSITDGVLICFITASQLGLYAVLRGWGRWPVVLGLGLAIGLGLLTKGPVVLGVMGMTLIALFVLGRIDGRRLGRFRFSLVKTLVCVAIAGGVYMTWGYRIEQRLPGYHWRTLKAEVLDRAAKPQEGHKGPPGYYLLTVWGTYLPWSLLLPATAVSAWRHRHRPAVRFAMAAVLGPWIMFEIVQTKLMHYFLPAFPPLAFLTADMLVRMSRAARRGVAATADRAFQRAVVFWAGVIVLVSLLPWLAAFIFGTPDRLTIAVMIVLPILAAIYGWQTFRALRGGRLLRAAVVMGVGMLLLIGILYGAYLPRADYLHLSRKAAALLRPYEPIPVGQAMMIDYKEMSLPFEQGGTIRPQRANRYLEYTPPADWPAFIVLTREVWDATPQPLQAQLDVIGRARGWSYADNGRIVELLVLRKREAIGN